MKKTVSFLLFILLNISILLSGCENQEPVQSETPETSISSESGLTAEPTPTQPSETENPEQTEPSETENTESESSEEENSEMKMNVSVNGQDFTATLEQNSAVDALVRMMESGPVTLQLSDYSGFEKVGPLGQSLPASNSRTTTHAGDIVLYQGIRSSCFMARIPGAIQGWAILTTLPAGRKR